MNWWRTFDTVCWSKNWLQRVEHERNSPERVHNIYLLIGKLKNDIHRGYIDIIMIVLGSVKIWQTLFLSWKNFFREKKHFMFENMHLLYEAQFSFLICFFSRKAQPSQHFISLILSLFAIISLYLGTIANPACTKNLVNILIVGETISLWSN